MVSRNGRGNCHSTTRIRCFPMGTLHKNSRGQIKEKQLKIQIDFSPVYGTLKYEPRQSYRAQKRAPEAIPEK